MMTEMATSKKRDRVGIRRLKNQASRIVEEVREGGGEYIVTKRGKPVAVIRPWRNEDERERRRLEAKAVVARLGEIARAVASAAERHEAAPGAVAAVSRQRR